MRKYICLIFTLVIFSGCKEEVKLIYSPDKQYCISQFDITEDHGVGYTIFTYGKHSPDRMPEAYIKVRYRWRDGWEGLIKWNGAEVTLFHPYYDFEAVNLGNSLLKNEIMESQEFYLYFFDKVPNDFIKVSSVSEYNTKQ